MSGFGPITQLGYLTNDLDKSANLWAKVMGVGPFTKMAGVIMPATMDGATVDIKINLALAYQDDVQIELIQPLCDSPSPYQANKRAGIWGSHHTQFTVDDLDAAIANCEASGMEMACEITSAGSRYIYMRSDAGWIELTTPNPGLAMMFHMIKQSCADWDGESVWNVLG
ncbi:MAG: VOC family protein [Acidimicrobiales bacterium]|nr:VOC family protein [Hyphomonadaceae bacterium]RZV40879.1 MAG: VOC family protein [Acidimicrobiales bacterium]